MHHQEKQDHGKTAAWLELFLQKKFFNNCSAHNLSKNETNMYCINCDLPICKKCASESGSCDGHTTLRIYRHAYQDAVVAKALKQLIDCSKIQLYKCNKHQIVSLHPLEHKGKDEQVEKTSSVCDICKRYLHNPVVYRYCSIKCKLEAFLKKGKATDPPFLERRADAADAAEAAPNRDTAAADVETDVSASVTVRKTNRRKRKGVPHRASN